MVKFGCVPVTVVLPAPVKTVDAELDADAAAAAADIAAAFADDKASAVYALVVV
jgi:hypothetical protein